MMTQAPNAQKAAKINENSVYTKRVVGSVNCNGAYLFLLRRKVGVLDSGLFRRLGDVELLVALGLVPLDPIGEVQLPGRGCELRWLEL